MTGRLVYIEKNLSKARSSQNKCGSFQKKVGGVERWQRCNHKNTLQFWPSFKIGNGFSST